MPRAEPSPRAVAVRALRGAITVDADTARDIAAGTSTLLRTLVAANALDDEDVVSAFFTVTPDLTADFPAVAARALGWTEVPMLCALEIPVPGALARCVRVLLHVETTRARHELRHCYLDGAAALRPDLAAPPASPATDGRDAGRAREARRPQFAHEPP